jgi:hypothetical protein
MFDAAGALTSGYSKPLSAPPAGMPAARATQCLGRCEYSSNGVTQWVTRKSNFRVSASCAVSVLVDADDHNDPISDAIRSTLDGHIVLDREIAEQGRSCCQRLAVDLALGAFCMDPRAEHRYNQASGAHRPLRGHAGPAVNGRLPGR